MNDIFVTYYKSFPSETFVLHKRTKRMYNEAVISPVPFFGRKTERIAYGSKSGTASVQAAGRLFSHLGYRP